jgi:hypothetical protein
MSDPVEFRLQLDVTAKSESLVTDYCIAHLRERGYHVAAPNEKWETPKEFNQRLGINHQGLQRALHRPGRPNVAVTYNPRRGKGCHRVLAICSNADFDAFVLKFKQ